MLVSTLVEFILIPDLPYRNSSTRDSEIEVDIQTFLSELEPNMKKLVAGDIILPLWFPPSDIMDPELVAHLTSLRIPLLRGKPNLLLHDLGRFSSDFLLEKRLSNIFMPNNHTSVSYSEIFYFLLNEKTHRFLVNTSGSGKTRLLFEGLCENWGFYFTSLVDSSLLGSSDVQKSIQTHVPDSPGFRPVLPPSGSAGYDGALRANRVIASRNFRQIFLARLIMFNLFAQNMSGRAGDPRLYRERWLLLQLQPSILHPRCWDIFHELSCKLSGATDSFINTKTKTLLTNIRSVLWSAITTGSHTTEAQMLTSGTAQTPLFCVLDEAQHAATQHTTAFRSDQNGAHRPILREIVKAWESQSFGQGVFMVVAGTGISKDVVDQAMASAIMKDSRYRWCSDTGAFDRKDVQQRYMQKYLPKRLLESDVGVRLLERVWYWLHGRFVQLEIPHRPGTQCMI